MSLKPKVLFAAGGTGGHLFPAQALAEKLEGAEVLFAGAKLSSNPYFSREKFRFSDITSTTPFRGNLFQKIQTLKILAKGVWESLRLLSKEKPDLMVGFGSFHSFPLLCAAVIKKIPLILFESNAVPGKVIRLFSRFALYTAVYFPESRLHLKGDVVPVAIPSLKILSATNPQDARAQLGLDPALFTVLVFGGSQGAQAINQLMTTLLPRLKKAGVPFQLIHLAGKLEWTKGIEQCCASYGIKAYVRDFEPRMDLIWSSADAAICRSGAATLSEMLHYGVPGILIPFPHAADQHQLKNARFVEKVVKGAFLFEESSLDVDAFQETLMRWAHPESAERKQMKENILHFSTEQKKGDLTAMIHSFLQTLSKEKTCTHTTTS